jgi:hypothetical protein
MKRGYCAPRLVGAIVISLFALAIAYEPLHASTRSPPARIANVYGGFDHQPRQSEVDRREQAAGIALKRSQQERYAATLNELYQELEGKQWRGRF